MTNAEAFLVEDLHLLLYISECKNNFQNPTLSDGLYLYVRKNNAPHMPYSTDTFGKELYNAAQSASLAACTSPSLLLVCCVHTGCAKTVLHVAKKKRDNNCVCV